MEVIVDIFTAALIENGKARLSASGKPCWNDAGALRAANINEAITAIGGTRGLAHRGRLVVTTESHTFVFDAASTERYSDVTPVLEFDTIADAEAYARRERRGDGLFRTAATFEAALASRDGRGWGR